MLYGSQQNSFTLTDTGDMTMSTTALPKYITDKLHALRDARAARQNYQALTDVVTGIARCQKKDTEVQSQSQSQSQEAESQWRTLFRKLRGEMTPERQAQHHSRISKRELAKEFDGD